jgi:fumarylacetoacetase
MTGVTGSILKSWVESANLETGDFPLQNLPYGVFDHNDGLPRCGVAIGAFVLDLAALELSGLLPLRADIMVFARPALNDFMALGSQVWAQVRSRLTELLMLDGDPALSSNPALLKLALIPRNEIKLHLPIKVSAYTDFYASRHHAFNVGALFRGPENALPSNWLSIPIGYNGRASTVVVSGTDIRRPLGQLKIVGNDLPSFGASERLDFELEIGAIVGTASKMGEPITVGEAYDMIFGYVLLNDWSARDIQAWEYQPLGPFQSKAFATSISPWVVSKDALAPFRVSTPPRERPLLPYLSEPMPMLYDVELEVRLQPGSTEIETTISRTNYKEVYYSPAQQLAHHAICGCKMETGDLLGSGTISGPMRESCGSLLELSRGGAEPLLLESGEQRAFLKDHDVLTLVGWAQGNGYRVGFGECRGAIVPAPIDRSW